MVAKTTNLFYPRAKSAFLTSSWIAPGGAEITEFAPSSSGINVFELGGCEKTGSEISEFAASPSGISIFDLEAD